jgi:HK97 gp10 family phage protein
MGGAVAFQQLDAMLAKVDAALSGASLESATLQGAKLVLDEARIRAPVRSGNLRAHLEAVGSHTAHTAQAVVQVADSAPGGTVREAIFSEFGTSRQAPTPYLRPAFAYTKNKIPTVIERQLSPKLKD